MKITIDSLERYGNWLNGIANDASEQFRRAVLELAAEMEAEHGDISGWSREQIAELRDFASDMMVEVWHTHGDASASIGSMMFEESVGEEVPDDAMMSDQVSEERARASAKYWAKHLFGESPSVDKFVDGCASFVDRNVSHAADIQIIDLADELAAVGKEVRYARVPRGPSCGFCIMLASRGFVYASKKTAGDLGGAFNDFHDHCDCRVIAGYEGLEVEGYDYHGMYERYLQCRKAIGDYEQVQEEWNALSPEERDQYGRGERVIPLSEDPAKDAELRKQLGKQADGFNDYLARRIVQEMDTRDREWLYDKTIHNPTYATDKVKKSATEDNPWEDRTARRLARHGIKPDFIQDYRWKVGADGIKRKVGLPDFANGVEIKTPITSKNPYGAVDNYLDNCTKKEGIKRIIIDNTESNFTDDELKKALESVMKDYSFDSVTYLGKDDNLHVVRKR